MSDMNRPNIWSHRIPDPCLNLGNGFFILPKENVAVGEPSSTAYPNMQSSNTHFSSGSNSCFLSNGTTNLGASSDPYLHHSSESSCGLIPQIYARNGSSYGQLSIRGLPSASNSQNGHQSLNFKRKPYAHPLALDVVNSNEYHGAGSSNGFSISSNQHLPNRMGSPVVYRSNGALATGVGSGSQRNVRTRHGHAIHLENNLATPQTLSRHFSHSANTLNYPSTSLDSSHRLQSSGSFFHHEMNQPSGGNSRHTSIIPTREASRYDQRLNYLDTASRYSRSGDRNGRMRGFYDTLSYRTSTLANDVYAHSRWAIEESMVIDRSLPFNHHFLPDQHRDMRLDVDSMSYEELLALGERIGNVNTGLSDDNIARCLTIFSSCQKQNAEEGSCVICLEEYEDGQSIGMLNCRHEFHASCIKKWLHIKNACPVCKAAALGDTAKGKQVLVL